MDQGIGNRELAIREDSGIVIFIFNESILAYSSNITRCSRTALLKLI